MAPEFRQQKKPEDKVGYAKYHFNRSASFCILTVSLKKVFSETSVFYHSGVESTTVFFSNLHLRFSARRTASSAPGGQHRQRRHSRISSLPST